MVSDNQQSEGLELTPLTISGMQDDPPLTEEVSIVGNDLQYESLVAEQRHQRQQLLHTYVFCIEIIHNTFLSHAL